MAVMNMLPKSDGPLSIVVERIGEDPRYPGEGILCVDLVVNGTPHIRLHQEDSLAIRLQERGA